MHDVSLVKSPNRSYRSTRAGLYGPMLTPFLPRLERWYLAWRNYREIKGLGLPDPLTSWGGRYTAIRGVHDRRIHLQMENEIVNAMIPDVVRSIEGTDGEVGCL